MSQIEYEEEYQEPENEEYYDEGAGQDGDDEAQREDLVNTIFQFQNFESKKQSI